MWFFVIGFGLGISALMFRPLIAVVTTSVNKRQCADAIRMFGFIWGGGTVGTGAVRLYELGIL